MKIELAPHPVGIPHGTLVLVFGKVVYSADAALVAALQDAGVVERFPWVPRALNTKVLGLPWVLPRSAADVAAQTAALKAHSGVLEVAGFAVPELRGFYLDTDHEPKKVPYIDGGELALAMAEAAPARLGEAMPYLRAPQRHDWFIDRLFAIAEKTKDPKAATYVWTAIADMPVPPASNKHHKTYALALERGAAAFRAVGDAAGAARLAERAAGLGAKPKAAKAAAPKKAAAAKPKKGK